MTDLSVAAYAVNSPSHNELLKWLRINDLNPHDMPHDTVLMVAENDGDWVIRYEKFARNRAGDLFMAANDEPERVDAVAPLMFDPPAHWLVPVRGAQV